jgi:hypothetical protein
MAMVISMAMAKDNCVCNGSGSCQRCKNNNPRGCNDCSVKDGFAGTWTGKRNKPAGTCQICL